VGGLQPNKTVGTTLIFESSPFTQYYTEVSRIADARSSEFLPDPLIGIAPPRSEVDKGG
jgi:hypothetical protein